MSLSKIITGILVPIAPTTVHGTTVTVSSPTSSYITVTDGKRRLIDLHGHHPKKTTTSSSSIVTIDHSHHHHHHHSNSTGNNNNPKRCGCILYDPHRGKYLLVRGRDSHKWGFPKGHMENGEMEEETAIREFFEETGLDIHGPFDGRVRFGNNVYFAKTRIENRTLDIHDKNEIDDIRWFTKKEILQFPKESCNFGLSMWRKHMMNLSPGSIHAVGSHARIHGTLLNNTTDTSSSSSQQSSRQTFPVLQIFSGVSKKKWFDRLSIPSDKPPHLII